MKKIKIFSAVFVIAVSTYPNSGYATDNVDWIGRWFPNIFAELLDCEYRNDTLFVAGVSGFSMVDVSDFNNPVLLGRYTPPGHPYERFYHIAVGNGYAYGFGRDDGISIIDFGGPGNPIRIDVYPSHGIAFEDGQIQDDLLYVTAHSRGLYIFELGDRGELDLLNSVNGQLTNATALAIEDTIAFVADGAGGISVLNIADPDAPIFLSQINTTGAAQDIGLYGDYAAVAVGGLGVDVIDFSDPANPQFGSNIAGEGSAFNLSVENGLAYVARWEGVEVIDVSDPHNLFLAGWEDTPSRAMGLTVNDSIIFVADWANVEIYRFGEGIQADIHIDFSLMDMGDVAPGEVADTVFTVFNTGGSALTINNIVGQNYGFSVTPTDASIPADSSYDFMLSFEASDSEYRSTVIFIHSDDPDEPTKAFRAFANGAPRLNIGDPAPDFTLMGIDGRQYTLSDYYGRVVLLAFFASW